MEGRFKRRAKILFGSYDTMCKNSISLIHLPYRQRITAFCFAAIIMCVHCTAIGAVGDLLTIIENPESNSLDQFGISVAAASMQRALIGAYQDDTGGFNAGSVYLIDIDPLSPDFRSDAADPEKSDSRDARQFRTVRWCCRRQFDGWRSVG